MKIATFLTNLLDPDMVTHRDALPMVRVFRQNGKIVLEAYEYTGAADAPLATIQDVRKTTWTGFTLADVEASIDLNPEGEGDDEA